MNIRLANRFRSTVTQSKRVRKTKSVLEDLHATSLCGTESLYRLVLGEPVWMEMNGGDEQMPAAARAGQLHFAKSSNTTRNHYGYVVATS